MKYALINGVLLDGTEAMQPRPGLTVLVNGDRIEALVPAGDEGAGYEKIDLSGGYVMPGLINLHVHLPASGKPTVKQKDPKKAVRLMTSTALLRWVAFRVCAGYAKTELLSGVTTLRSVGGIPVGLGTDTGCPYITHYDMWREVYYFHKFCGVSNAFALHTATLGNARIAGLGEETGSVEPGKCADLIVTRQNPLEDLKALRHIDLVMGRGNLIRAPKVKK